MTELATDTIAIRAGFLWAVGVFGSGLIGGFLASLPSGPRSGWIVFPILAMRIPLFLGPTGIGLIVVRLTDEFSKTVAYAAIGMSIVTSLWLSLIAAQVAQNIACRLFGAKTQPIRWWSGDDGK